MRRAKTIFLFAFAMSLCLTSYAQISFNTLEEQDTEIQVEMYPNPAVSYINVNLTIIPESQETPILEVYNVLGNRIKVEISEEGPRSYQVRLDQLPTGYYFMSVKIPNTDIHKTFKFLKR